MPDTVATESLVPTRLAIGITVFRPETTALDALIAKVARSSSPILLQIDGPVGEAIESAYLDQLTRDPRIRISQSGINLGIAFSLNRLVEQACELSCEWIVFFDQDSDPPWDAPANLRRGLIELEHAGENPAVIGPIPVAVDAEHSKAPRYRERTRPVPRGRCIPVDFLITSGSLMRISTLRRIGPFREDFRIDAVDTEWCFRAWSLGFTVWSDRALAMPHRVGSGILRLGPIRFPHQNARRMETYVRNQARMLRMSHVPWRWKMRTILYLPVQIGVYLLHMRAERRTGIHIFWRAALEGIRR